ncbi:VWA domain-containing protein, partial [Vibrio breoganii]
MSNFEFLYPEAFWLLIPLAAIIMWLKSTTANSQVIASHLAAAMADKPSNSRRHYGWVALLGVILTVSLAGPSFERQAIPVSQSENARVLVLDMSRSVYANDIKPSRLAQIKYKAQDLLPLLNQGQTGLVAYAGDAYTLSPLTTDSATLANLVQNLSPEIMPIQGARADLAVKQAISIMKQAGLNQGEIVLFADDLDTQELEQIKAQLSEGNWTLSVLAFGTSAGAPIQLSDGSLLTTNSGKTVIAKTQLGNLRAAARAGNGQFEKYRHDNQDIANLVSESAFEAVNTNAKGEELEAKINNGFWLLPLALLCALPLFRKGVIFSFVAMMFSFGFTPNHAQASVLDNAFSNANQRGLAAFQEKDYQRASQEFKDTKWRAAAQYESGDYEGAITSLEGHSETDSLYNLGNAYAQNGELDKAIASYEKVLQQEPENADAKYNLDIVQQQQQQQ